MASRRCCNHHLYWHDNIEGPIGQCHLLSKWFLLSLPVLEKFSQSIRQCLQMHGLLYNLLPSNSFPARLWLRWFNRAALLISLANILQKVKDKEENVPEDSYSNDEYRDSNQTVSPQKLSFCHFFQLQYLISVERECLYHPTQ